MNATLMPAEPPSAKCARCPFHIREICESPVAGQPIPAALWCCEDVLTDEELIRRHRVEKERNEPAVSFERGIAETVAWFRERG